jgi:hypothetical protein
VSNLLQLCCTSVSTEPIGSPVGSRPYILCVSSLNICYTTSTRTESIFALTKEGFTGTFTTDIQHALLDQVMTHAH